MSAFTIWFIRWCAEVLTGRVDIFTLVDVLLFINWSFYSFSNSKAVTFVQTNVIFITQKAKLQNHVGSLHCGQRLSMPLVGPKLLRASLKVVRKIQKPESFHSLRVQKKWSGDFAKFRWNCTAGLALYKKNSHRRYCGWPELQKWKKLP